MNNPQDLEKVKAQHEAGKLTARERIEKIADNGSFVEMYAMLGNGQRDAGVVTGYATIDCRPVYLFAQDFTVHGGAMGQMQAEKILRLMDAALKNGAPVIGVMDSAGVCIDEAAQGMDAFGRIYSKMADLSGVCPLLTVIAGPCIGGAALISQLSDISIAVEKISSVMVFGPQVMAAMNGVNGDLQSFGGAKVAASCGTVALTAENENQAFGMVKTLFGLLPGCNLEDTELFDNGELSKTVSENASELFAALPDEPGIELYPDWGKGIRTQLCRMGGRSVALLSAEGKLDAASLRKAARFVRFADAFGLSLVSLINTDGVEVNGIQGQADLIKAQSQLLYACAEATCPKISVVTGNAIGQSYIALGGKANADVTYAWPDAVISALTPAAAVAVLYSDKVKNATELSVQKAREKYAADYVENTAGALCAAKAGLVDDVIQPAMTRPLILSALEMLASKRQTKPAKKHGNLPL